LSIRSLVRGGSSTLASDTPFHICIWYPDAPSIPRVLLSVKLGYYRRNLLAFMGDYVFFQVGMAFLNSTTVLPSLARQLTASTPLVGLISTMSSGLWMLPQLVAANYVTGKPRKKPYLMLAAGVGRPFTWLFALLLFLGLGQYPLLLYGVFILWVIIFWSCDGLASVPWFHLVSKTIPPERRGWLFGLGQTLGGVLAVGVGFIVRYLLGEQGPPFPTNYAWLFMLGGAAFFISLGSISMLKETPEPASIDRSSWRAYLPKLVSLLRKDANFRLVTLVRLLLGAGGMAIPFYILYATEDLGLSTQAIGFFTSVQVGTSVLLGLLLGYLHERAGSKRVIQLGMVMALMAPVGALLIPPLVSTRGSILLWSYALVFIGLQGVMSSGMLGFMNFVMETAPRAERPTYIGLANTLNAVQMIYPLLGGLLLKVISYPDLFIITALIIGPGLLLTTRLREPRQEQLTEQEAPL
ncbi:MAG: MFS transporter, partial [Chloroflexota bacterium]|nr:MFS transporter [Chloroflexota bacterium]